MLPDVNDIFGKALKYTSDYSVIIIWSFIMKLFSLIKFHCDLLLKLTISNVNAAFEVLGKWEKGSYVFVT